MISTWVKVGGTNYEARKLTAGDVAAILPLVDRIQALKNEQDPLALARILPQALDATAATLGCPRDRLDKLPLHEAMEVLHHTLESWLAVNGPYMAEEIAPAVQQLGQSLSALSAALSRSPNRLN